MLKYPSNLLGLESLPPQSRKDAVGPVVGGDVQRAEHLRGRDGFGVHPHLPVGGAALRHCLHQRVDAGRLPGSAGTQRHHTCMSMTAALVSTPRTFNDAGRVLNGVYSYKRAHAAFFRANSSIFILSIFKFEVNKINEGFTNFPPGFYSWQHSERLKQLLRLHVGK